MKKLTGNKDIEDSLERLDKLTQEEARMASVEQLKMTHNVDEKVMGVDDRVRGVERQVEDVHGDVRDVGNKVQHVEDRVQDVGEDISSRVQNVDDRVQSVDDRVQSIDDRVQSIDDRVQSINDRVQSVDDRVQSVDDKVQSVDDRVQGVDDKLDQANRSLSLQSLIIIPRAQTPSQGISSETNFFDGSRPQIHPPIITSHVKLITTVPLSGFFKEVYSINGSPLARSCGCMENVCYS